MNNWTRAQLKDRAKDVLRVNYWIAFVVALILTFVSSGGGGTSSSFNNNHDYSYSDSDIQFDEIFDADDFNDVNTHYENVNSPFGGLFAGLTTTIILLIAVFSIAISIFVFNPLAVGCYKFFSSSAEIPHKNMAPVGLAFKRGNYWGIVKGMFLMQLFTFLWTLLFIIPGIIKAYAYRMVPYILADNPEMDANEAISLSRKMMSGEKWNAFVLDLSFIGWYLLGLLACGIGIIFVNPYKFSTDAQLYLVLRATAINQKYCTPEMLNLTAN